MASNCIRLHFEHWLEFLQPRVVVCAGKWAHDQVGHILAARSIPHTYMNRRRDLPTVDRRQNRAEAVALVRKELKPHEYASYLSHT